MRSVHAADHVMLQDTTLTCPTSVPTRAMPLTTRSYSSGRLPRFPPFTWSEKRANAIMGVMTPTMYRS
jgi:hypothetical protein